MCNAHEKKKSRPASARKSTFSISVVSMCDFSGSCAFSRAPENSHILDQKRRLGLRNTRSDSKIKLGAKSSPTDDAISSALYCFRAKKCFYCVGNMFHCARETCSALKNVFRSQHCRRTKSHCALAKTMVSAKWPLRFEQQTALNAAPSNRLEMRAVFRPSSDELSSRRKKTRQPEAPAGVCFWNP